MDLLEIPTSGTRHPWEMARYKIVKSLIDREVDDYSGKNILDLGSGDLFFLEKFARDKPDTRFFAVDTAYEESFTISKRKSIELFKSLEDLPVHAPLDIVFLMDVIEHIENDLAFLMDLINRPIIGENTILVITVPAYQKLFCYHDRYLGHFRRYTNTSLGNLVTKAGLKVVCKGYFFISLLLPRYLEVLAEKRRGGEEEVYGTRLTTWKGSRLLSKVLEWVLLIDFTFHKILKKMGIQSPGLSNYMLCKKSVS